MGWDGLLGGLFRMGSTYLEHTRFVQTALATDKSKQRELLQNYVQALSDSAFSGFKITMLMLANKESDGRRKEAIQSLLGDADRARIGEPTSPQSGAEANEAGVEDDDPQVEMMNGWFEIKDETRRVNLLLDHLTTLDQQKYSTFGKNLQTYRTVKLEMIKNHEANELNAWGPYFEDRADYFQARERIGVKDPVWQGTHDELKSHFRFIEETIRASEAAWQFIAKEREGK